MPEFGSLTVPDLIMGLSWNIRGNFTFLRPKKACLLFHPSTSLLGSLGADHEIPARRPSQTVVRPYLY